MKTRLKQTRTQKQTTQKQNPIKNENKHNFIPMIQLLKTKMCA